ncbi:hypothetical protein [Actinomadura xylanilytica]|uniref:hypothetical protein n=1 Tax=Actinomadura xylanilytica TaxID=887459 RepID=UPI00255A782A|nr:hypothetical protein [Actinomadura xylanilytica]MDL4775760.1 hypothetical protein [Actinomadura xylanilytica]
MPLGLPVNQVELVAVTVDQDYPASSVLGIAGDGLVERRGDDLFPGVLQGGGQPLAGGIGADAAPLPAVLSGLGSGRRKRDHAEL